METQAPKYPEGRRGSRRPAGRIRSRETAKDPPDGGAEEAPEDPAERRRRGQWRDIGVFLLRLAAVALFLWALFGLVMGVLRMDGESMYPRIRDGDLVIFYRLERDFTASDVLVYEKAGERRTARIVAMEGDVVELSEDGMLIVNGSAQVEEVYFSTEAQPGGITYPYTVPSGSYFVLTDCRTDSEPDSRTFGAVSEEEIVGQVVSLFRRRGI